MTEEDKFLRVLAKKYNLSPSIVKLMTESPFRMLSDEMDKQSWKGTKFIGIGTFVSPEWRVQYWKEGKALREQRLKEEQEKNESISANPPRVE